MKGNIVDKQKEQYRGQYRSHAEVRRVLQIVVEIVYRQM